MSRPPSRGPLPPSPWQADAALRAVGCAPALRVGGLEEVRGSWEGPDGRPQPEYGFMSSGPCGCPGGLTVQPEAISAGGADEALGFGVLPADDVLALDWFTPADRSALQRSGAVLALQLTVRRPYYRTRF